MRVLSRHNPVVAVVLAALCVVLPGCGAAGSGAPGDGKGFEPITCSATPSPCA